MKKILLLFSLVVAVLTTARAQVYVDAAASGTGDGTTWANAYTNLADALAAADTAAAVWIASGTYVTPTDSSFYIDHELSLYGGFAGGETNLSDADPATNATILSGDVMGNDNATGYDSLLAVDNNRVLTIRDTADESRYTVTIDGITITNGAIAADFDTGSLIPFAGGGIYSDAKLAVSRTRFTRNKASFGAASTLIFSTANGSTFNEVTTEGNYGTRSAQHYIRLVDSVSITNSLFDGAGDSSATNMIQVISGNGFFIDSCEFKDYTTLTFRGAAINTSDVLGISITNSTFTDLTADLGGALYFRNGNNLQGDRAVSADECVVDNCTFSNIQSLRWGGTIFNGNISHRVSNSTFTNGSGNQNGGLGGVVYAQNTDTLNYQYLLSGNQFTENTTGTSGGAVFYFTDNLTDVQIIGNDFDSNTAPARGGALYFATFGGPDPVQVTVDSCTFSNSIVEQDGFISGGSAIYISGGDADSPTVMVRNSSFENNATIGSRSNGTIAAVNGIDLKVVGSDFFNNTAGGSAGAIYLVNLTDTVRTDGILDTVLLQEAHLDVDRSLFVNNTAANQGGVADLQSASVSMVNSIFIGNAISLDGGSGGAIIINGTNNATLALDNYLINNTFLNNLDGGRAANPADTILGSSGNAVALFQEGGTSADSNSVTLTIQNNAFFQATTDEESLGIEQTGDDGAIVVRSLGGNYFNQTLIPQLPITMVSGKDIVNDTVDVVETLFSDPFGDFADFPEVDLIRGDGNPLIDGGTNGPLVPTVDFFNENRDAIPDIGAIEYNGLRVDLAEPIENSGLEFEFFPNPTADVLNIVNNDQKIQRFTVLVSDMQGRVVSGRQFGASKNRLDLTALPVGVYNLSLMIEGKAYSKQIVKR